MELVHREIAPRCFGIDAEDGRAVVLVERRSEAFGPAEWFALDEQGMEAIAERVTRANAPARVCVGSRGARALDVATGMLRLPQVELLLLFERGRPACADAAAQAAHARQLAASAHRAP